MPHSDPRTLNIWDGIGPTGSGLPASSQQIDRRDNLSQNEFVHEYVLRNRPVILTDAARNWPAVGKWTPAFLKARYGSKQVGVFERKRGLTNKATVPLGAYLDEIASSQFEDRGQYLFSLRIESDFPDLLQDLEPQPAYWRPNWLESRYLMPGFSNFKLRHITGLEMNMGGPGSRFPFLHYDDLWTQTFITQVCGRKVWALYPPDQTPYMYPTKEADCISEIPMDGDVDLSRYPLFARATPIRFILEEGEMLYGAPGWWHTTLVLTPSIAVVLSTANNAIWGDVTASAFKWVWRHPKWYMRPAAVPIAAYMTAFRAVKAMTDPV